jgi:hypothetical protein
MTLAKRATSLRRRAEDRSGPLSFFSRCERYRAWASSDAAWGSGRPVKTRGPSVDSASASVRLTPRWASQSLRR